jgi:3-methyladenine DNA glycosylase/8-oxoguanine DNA glycosylase
VFRWIALCCMTLLHQLSHRCISVCSANAFSMARRSSRSRTRSSQRTKRPFLSSTTLASSPYFSDSSKRPKNQDCNASFDEDEDDILDTDSLAGSAWVPTSELPSHLIGNKYFDDDDKKKNGITLLLRTNTPEGFSLSQAICSYGYFCLAPNRWVPGKSSDEKANDGSCISGNGAGDDEGYLVRPLTYITTTTEDEPPYTAASKTKTAVVAVGQDTRTKSVLMAIQSSFLVLDRDHHKEQQLTKQIDRMLRLDTILEDFHELYPEAGERGFGRLYRSPTLFEDMVKTITNCNMKWGGTVEMNAKLCKKVGSDGAFPTPEEIQRVGADFLKEHCRVGYRGKYIWNLANDIVEGRLDLSRDLGSTPRGGCCHNREDVKKRLLKISGIGPFAANNILQLMGYFDSHPYDTETVRLWKEDFGASKSATKAEVFKNARAHYSKYEPYAFTAYWYDLWKNYEKRAGARSPQWSIEQFENERPCGVESDHNSVFANPPSSTTSGSKRGKPKRTKRDVATAPN